MRKSAHFFLGANSCRGFFSLYDGLLGGQLDDLMILKGGPGCGKSTFMKHIANRCEKEGKTVDYIHCSGDPQSLDGIILPDLRVGIADGTAPHIIEPKFAIVQERYVDLSRFYQLEAVKKKKQEICPYFGQYQARYRDAYRILRAVGAVEEERKRLLSGKVNTEKTAHYIKSALAGECSEMRTGRSADIFLGGLTHEGPLCRYDTVNALCKKVYEISDRYGLAGNALASAAESLEAAGEDVLICRDPLFPERVEHLILPGRSLAVVTGNDRWHYPHRAYRRIRLNAFAEHKLSHGEKGKLRLLNTLQKSLCEDAISQLKEAKTAHDLLEQAYHPYVDFDAVTALAEEEANRILRASTV